MAQQICYTTALVVGKVDEKLSDLDGILTSIMKNQYHNKPLYEVLGKPDTNQMVRPYFDLDLKLNETNRDIDFEPILEKACQWICNKFSCNREDLMISFAHRVKKYSSHIVIPSQKVQLQNLIDWHKENEEELKENYLDPSVYRTYGKMRMIGTSVLGKKSPLVYQNGELRDHIITVLSGQEKEIHLELKNPASVQKKLKLKTKINNTKNETSSHEYEIAVKLCNLLKNDDLDWPSWNEVGLCLHNIDERLKEQWIEFSKKSSKYNETATLNLWAGYKCSDTGLKIGTLKWMAKRDNSVGYQVIQREFLDTYILKAQSQTTLDVAIVIDKMYHDEFVFCGKKGWYQFVNHRWNVNYDGCGLMGLIGTKVLAEFNRIKDYYSELACGTTDQDQISKCQNISHNLFDITLKLRDYTFRTKLRKELEILMLDVKFESKLNSNIYLLGFENGIFDLEHHLFREGRPTDYLSMSVGYDYCSYEENDPLLVDVFQFLKKTFPQPIVDGEKYDVCDAMLIIYSSILEGKNKDQHFYIQSNNGSNGKSQIIDLLDQTLGEYSKSVSANFFCDQVKKSASSASPELACLNGIRFIHSEEPDDDDILNVSKIKEYTGGSKISTRANYGDPFEFTPQFKTVFSCNKLPSFKNVTESDLAIWRRVKNLPFQSTFVDQDQSENEEKYIFHKDLTLGQKIPNWRQPFMFILLEWYKTYKTEGLTFLEVMKVANEAYKKQVNPLYEFFNDFIEETTEPTNEGLTLGLIWNSYQKAKAYYKKGILKKDVKKYLEEHNIPMIDEKRVVGKHLRSVYPSLKWIDTKSDEQQTIMVNELKST